MDEFIQYTANGGFSLYFNDKATSYCLKGIATKDVFRFKAILQTVLECKYFILVMLEITF